MKNIILLPVFFFFLFSYGQNDSKPRDVQRLLDAMKVKSNMKKLVNGAFELYKKEKPAVPQQIWSEIESKVDYAPYVSEVFDIYNKNYSQTEIRNLINTITHLKTDQQPQLSSVVIQQSYAASKSFGKNLSMLIRQQLKDRGF